MPEIRHEVAVQIRFISSGIESQKGTPTVNLCGDQDLVFEQDQIERVLLRNRFAKMDRARLRPPPITDSKMNRRIPRRSRDNAALKFSQVVSLRIPYNS
jgi:hypothetical protein